MKKYIFFVLSLLISVSTFSQGIEIRRAGSGISIKDGNTTRTYPKGVGTLLEGGTLYLRTGQQIIRSIPSHTVVSVPSAASLSALQDSILVLLAPLPTLSTGEGGEVSSAAIQSALGYTPANAATVAGKANASEVTAALDNKQDLLVPGTTIKTVDGASPLGSGDIVTKNASNLTSGTLPDARLSANIPNLTRAETFTNKTISGSSNTITNINGSNIATGTVPDARLSSEITKNTATQALSNKTIDGDVNTVQDLPQAATKFLSDSLAKKANSSTVAAGLALKANITDVNAALDLKANATTVNAAIALKADASTTTAALGAKADASATTAALGLKADQSALTAGLAGKADATALTSGLAGKVGTTGDETIGGIKQWSTTQRFAGTWANKPLIVGITGQSGVLAFARGSDGSTQARIGYKSAGENNIIEIFAPGGSGAAELNTNGGTALKVFSDGRTVIQKGGTYTNDAHHDLQVKGPALLSSFVKIGGSIETNPDSIKIFANNDEAIAGGLAPGKVYKSEADNGDWLVKITRPVVQPVFSEKVSTGTTRLLWPGTSLEQSYKAQSPNQIYNIQRAANKTNPVYRFEIRQGENWASDSPNNTQNGAVKERTEMYQEGMSIPFDVDVWVAYSLYIEPGDSINYNNTNYYCMLGQWHPGDAIPSGGPSWAIELSGLGRLNLITRGQENLVPPFTGGRPYLVDQADTTVTRGEWHDMVFRVRQNKNTLTGQIDWWVDGRQIPLVDGGLAAIGNDHDVIGYWKFGIYRTSNANTLAVRYANMAVLVDPTNSNTVNPGTLKGRIDHPLPIN